DEGASYSGPTWLPCGIQVWPLGAQYCRCLSEVHVQAQVVASPEHVVHVVDVLVTGTAGNDGRCRVEQIQHVEAHIPGGTRAQFTLIADGTVPPTGRGHVV